MVGITGKPMNALSPSGVAVTEPVHLLDELQSSGFLIVVESGNLIVTPVPDPELTEQIRRYKPELLALLSPRRLTTAEKAAIGQTFVEFRDQHGHALVAAGWDRSAVFCGMDPTAIETVDDIPGILALLWAGGRVERITEQMLYFRRMDGSRVAWLRSQCFVGDPYLREIESKLARG